MSSKIPNEEGLLSVHLAVQRSRAAAFVGMYGVAMAGKFAGILDFDVLWAHALLVTTVLSAVLFYELYRRRLYRRLKGELKSLWMACDVVFITWLVGITHGASNLWLVWYLSNTAAAAFVAGRRAALAVAAANSLAYLTLLVLLGEIQGFDHGLITALIHLALLYGASFFFLRGIADLRDKRLRIRELARERSRQLEELRRLTTALDRQTSELAQAHLQSQEASHAKSQFLANMSHELRTPLNSIIGFSEILSDKLADDLEPRYRKFLGNILEAGRHLLGLINDILDLSKIEAGKMELSLEPVSLSEISHGVRSVMHGIAGQRGIELVVDIPDDLPILNVDGPKVKQILYNLVSNAVKFSPDRSRVLITARVQDEPAREGSSELALRCVELRVVDQGIGIAPEDQAAIFDEFRQVDGESTRAHGGTGLGLTLVRRFVEMHGGNVAVESTPGQGSTFRIRLPVDAAGVMLPADPDVSESATADAAGSPDTAEHPTPRPIVMVVEDDEPFYRALAADLESAGFRPHWVRLGEEAAATARELRPAAITLDLTLPGMDGWEVLKQLKENPDTAHIPVIIVSLLGNHELGFALGAEDYFLKPLERRRFLGRLQELLGEIGPTPRPALIIDDDPQVHEVLEDELTQAGYEVLSAHDGRHGHELALARQPAVIVLDLMMPQMNGFEVAALLRNDPATADIPIVVLTAKELTAGDRERLRGKISGLVSKAPMDRRAIVRKIRGIEQRRH